MMNYFKQDKKTAIKFWLKLLVVAHIIGIVVNYILFKSEFWDNGSKGWDFWNDNARRGGLSVQQDLFKERSANLHYLDQGWSVRESLWFYYTSQGSNLLPYDFFLSLEQENNTKLFRDVAHLKKYRYLMQQKTIHNPDALPVGFAKDKYQGKEYLGFTCAACHTSQINYRRDNTDYAIRIDGGPAQSDMDTFMVDLGKTLMTTLNDKNKRKRFVERVLSVNSGNLIFTGSDNYDDEKEVLEDLEKFSNQFRDYNHINHSNTAYGFMRLDAIGRIYNRVAQHMIDEPTLKKVLYTLMPEKKVENLFTKVYLKNKEKSHLVQRVLNHLTTLDQEQQTNYKPALEKMLFNASDAPVSYPFLWGTPQHDYVQWDGIVDNSGLGPMGRNTGQVIGVFATLDWQNKQGFGLSAVIDSVLNGKKFSLDYTSYQSSLDVRNLFHIEAQLSKLHAPKWPENIFGTLDKAKMKRGQKIYNRYCESCHAVLSDEEKVNPERKIKAHFSSLDRVKTDPAMAVNAITKKGYSGFAKGHYVNTPVGNTLLQDKAVIAELLTAATSNVVATPNKDSNILVRWSDWIYDLFFSFTRNPIKPSIKQGDYAPSTSARPYRSLLAYKARPLTGIWATAPYLHNGSVPSLYDLLLPKKNDKDRGALMAFRPDSFEVGSRVFDAEKVGFVSKGYQGFIFDTALPGNSNAGHEYAAGKTLQPNNTLLPALKKSQRLDLLEYLKSL